MPALSVEPKWYRRTWFAAAMVIVALYAGLVLRFWAGGDGGVDQNAYLVGGRLLAEQHSMKYTLPNPYAYVGGMFVRVTPVDAKGNPVPGGSYFPKYPIGLPLLYACFFWSFHAAASVPFIQHHLNPHAIGYIPLADQAAYYAFLVSPIGAIFSVAGMFFLARQVSGSFAAALAAILLGSSQLMMMLADNPNSHASCTAFIVWGMFFLVRWMQTGSHWRGILGGLLVGYAATIRWNEMTLFVAMCIVVLSRLPWNRFATYRDLVSAALLGVAGYLIVTEAQAHYAGLTDPIYVWPPVHTVLNLAGVAALLLTASTVGVFSMHRDRNLNWLKRFERLDTYLHLFLPSVVSGLMLAGGAFLLFKQISADANSDVPAPHKGLILGCAIVLLAAGGIIGAFSVLRDRRVEWGLYVRALVPGLAWSIPVGALLLINLHTMGSPTGYDSTHESEFGAAFTWRFFHSNWEKVVRVFYDLGLFFVVPFAVAGIFMLFRRSWRLSLMMLGWLVPGVMLYMSYYWSPDRADAYARFFLTYLPALLVGTAVCFHDGILSGRKAISSFEGWVPKLATGLMLCWLLPGVVYCVARYWTPGPVSLLTQIMALYLPALLTVIVVAVHDIPAWWSSEHIHSGRVSLTVAVGMVVAIASGVSMYRTVHGLRDGTESAKIPLDDYRERLALAETGQVLLADVPAKSVVFTDASGGIANAGNYIQFLRDWELYPVDAFSYDGSRRGFGGGGGGNRRNNGGGGNGGGRNGGRFGGGGPGGPGGGGPPGMGGGMAGGNNQNDPNAATATPIQPEQQEYHASLYKNLSSRKLYQMESDVIQKAFSEGRRVFVVVGNEHSSEQSSRSDYFGTNTSDMLHTFKENLNSTSGKYAYKTITQWQDVSLPPEPEEAPDPNFWSNMNGPGGGRNGGMNRMFMAANRIMDWKLVEVKSAK